MIRSKLFVALRLGVIGFALLTWTYGVATFSPFAFDMFIRPRLMPSLSDFVAWHHVLYWVAYLATVVTLIDDLRARADGPRPARAAWGVAIGCVAVLGGVGVLLMRSPYLPGLENDRRSLVAAYLALLPLLALAVLDHMRAWPVAQPATAAPSQERLLRACLSAAGFVWLVSLIAWLMRKPVPVGEMAALAAWGWSLVLNLTIGVAAYVALLLVSSFEALPRPRPAIAHLAGVAVIAVGVSEWLRRVVLPAISLDAAVSGPLSVYSGVVIAAAWSGLSLRRAVSQPRPRSAADTLLWTQRPLMATAALAAVPFALIPLLTTIERVDWAYVLHRLAIGGVWIVAIGLFLSVYREGARPAWRRRLIIAPPLAALALAWSVPFGLAQLSRTLGDPDLAPAAIADQQAPIDASFRVSMGLLNRASIDLVSFRQRVLDRATAADRGTAVPTAVAATASPPAAHRPPHVFLFVIDSLRRDYLGAYNPQVTFTPAIDGFARESYVFRNAFTRYGGTWLSMPSIWVGGPVTRRWGDGRFAQMNALEQFIRRESYRFLINDFTVAMHLRADTAVTRLDPTVESADTDLCHLLQGLGPELDRAAGQPLFAFMAPMNVHIQNTHVRGGNPVDPRYPGFYAPYAARLERLDGCFGDFVRELKRRQIYDDSVIIITADHGDSLGEHGQWGHQHFMFPEDIRIPLLVHLPGRLRQGLTTDLERASFSTDITPTLYALTGRRDFIAAEDYGAPLFVDADRTLASRRDGSFLLTSSYGPAYALLRNNGKEVYVSDLINGREYGFDLHRGMLGTEVPVDERMRRSGQQAIEAHLERVSALYR